MLENYFAIFVFIVICFAGGIATIILSILINRYNKTKLSHVYSAQQKRCEITNKQAKYAPYECGFTPFNNARMRFNVRYDRFAIFFIIFDVEMAFFFPWAIACKQIGWNGMIGMGCFIGLLGIGLLYEWKKGALTWD